MIVGIEEIQDNNGTDEQRRRRRVETWNKLIDAITAAGGPTYELPADRPGQQRRRRRARRQHPRRVPLPHRPRISEFVDRPGGTSTNDTRSSDAEPAAADLQPGPARHRQPGVRGDAQAARRRVQVPRQGRCSSSSTTSARRATTSRCSAASSRRRGSARRTARAGAGRERLRRRRSREADKDANVVVLGDINDFEFSRRSRSSKARRAGDADEDPARERALLVRLRGQLAGARPDPGQPRSSTRTSRTSTTSCT